MRVPGSAALLMLNQPRKAIASRHTEVSAPIPHTDYPKINDCVISVSLAIPYSSSMELPKSRLSRLYYLYIYNTPLGVMTTNETIVFNSIAFVLVALLIYWLVAIFPFWLVKVAESLYYFLTGNTISLHVVLSLLVSRIVVTSSKHFFDTSNGTLVDGSTRSHIHNYDY